MQNPVYRLSKHLVAKDLYCISLFQRLYMRPMPSLLILYMAGYLVKASRKIKQRKPLLILTNSWPPEVPHGIFRNNVQALSWQLKLCSFQQASLLSDDLRDFQPTTVKRICGRLGHPTFSQLREPSYNC